MATETATARIAPHDHLTPRQVSEYLVVPETTLAVWRSTNRVVLPYFKLGGHVRYRRSDLDAFIAKSMRGVAA
jgi:excisionase family DNA binding protein